MTTHVDVGERTLPSLNLKKKRDCSAVYDQDGQKERVCNLLPLNQEGHSRKIAG